MWGAEWTKLEVTTAIQIQQSTKMWTVKLMEAEISHAGGVSSSGVKEEII